MGIEVENHMWIAVFAASFVQQYADEGKRHGSPGHALPKADDFTNEAMAVADASLESYRRVCHKEALGRLKINLSASTDAARPEE